MGSRRVEDAMGVNLNTILIKLKCENTQHRMDCIQLAHPTQLCYSVFLSALICRIYKWNIQTLFGFILLFLLNHTESLCPIIFLYIVMFYQDHRKYYQGCYGKLKLNICFQSLGGQFYIYFVFYVDTTLTDCYHPTVFLRSIHQELFVITRD